MQKNLSAIGKIRSFASSHKILSTFIILIFLGGVYLAYKSAFPSTASAQYIVSKAREGSITETVTGTGQISAENQIDVASKVSGEVLSIPVSVGQKVYAGQLLAQIDSGNAAMDLQNAEISYAKLTAPPKESELKAAEDNVSKAYNAGFDAVANSFIDLPQIITDMKSLLYSREGYLSDQKAHFLTSSARQYRDDAGISYDRAIAKYSSVLSEYKNSSRNGDKAVLDQLISDSTSMMELFSASLQDAQNAVTFIMRNMPEYQQSDAAQASSDTNAWLAKINSDLASIIATKNSIATAQNSLADLKEGADKYDIQSEQLSLEQKRTAYANYFIRAPFDGVVGKIYVNKYDQAGNGTAIAALIGDKKVSVISLNEVDAAKVQTGQPVALTFDAIDGLTATGTVSEVDMVGTVSQGVVSYGVKINVETADPRIKPGMSVNASIVTNNKSGVLIVPSSAIKSQGNTKYVEILASTSTGAFPKKPANGNESASVGASNFQRQGAPSSSSNSFTISASASPIRQIVTVGSSDDINTEITGGIQAGQFVITRTVTNGSTQSAPSILNSLGGNRSGTGMRVRQ